MALLDEVCYWAGGHFEVPKDCHSQPLSFCLQLMDQDVGS